MEPDPTVAYEMRKRAEAHKAKQQYQPEEKQPLTHEEKMEKWQLHIYNEVVKIRRWVVFFGILLIIALVITLFSLAGNYM